MNISVRTSGGILSDIHSMLTAGGPKSAQERQERKEKSEREIAFFERQKENLKNKECDTLEEIERKLEMLHSYEDDIAAVKAAYNRSEMFHILDEAREQGEKNAEAAEKLEPKTAEERKKELAEEALGLDEDKGVLSEALEELEETMEEIIAAEEITESLEALEEAAQELSNEADGQTAVDMDAAGTAQTTESLSATGAAEEIPLHQEEMRERQVLEIPVRRKEMQEQIPERAVQRFYERFDARA